MIVKKDLSGTSPAAASTVVGLAVGDLDNYDGLQIFATLTGATGGTLDVYLQVSPDDGTTWADYVHFPQLAAGAAAVSYLVTVSQFDGSAAVRVVGTGSTPALAGNTVVGGSWGARMRVVFVAGAATSAGAAQTIKLLCTQLPR